MTTYLFFLFFSLFTFLIGLAIGYQIRNQPTVFDILERSEQLEKLDAFESTGNVYWRYGTGHTILTGYTPRNEYPAAALETVIHHQTRLEQERHTQAANALVDQFLEAKGL